MKKPTKKPTKKAYTVTEAAKTLGISRQAVHDAIKRGLLEADKGKVVKIAWLIPAKALSEYRVSLSHKARGKKI